MMPRTWSACLAIALLVGCATLTPEQSAGLKEAQAFVDTVTDAYSVGSIKVVVGEESGYNLNARWIEIAPRFLGGNDQAVVLALFLGPPTLRIQQATPDNARAARRQGISIMVRFLDMTEVEAVDRLASLLIAHNEYLREDARRRGLTDWRLAWRGRILSHPCEQLRLLWADYSRSDPQPACDPAFPPK